MNTTIRYASIIILSLAVGSPVHAALPRQNPARDLAAEHAILRQFEGAWTEILTFKANPDAEPFILNGASQMKVVLGGRYLEFKTRGFSGESMHEGMSMMGFEPENERFSCVNFDNHETTFSVMYGKLNPALQQLEFEGCGRDGGKTIYTHTLPRGDRYRWSFKQIKADGTVGFEMTAIGTRLVK